MRNRALLAIGAACAFIVGMPAETIWTIQTYAGLGGVVVTALLNSTDKLPKVTK